MTRIEYVNHSLGNNFGDVIELNENLKNYPGLHTAILKHELKHTKNKSLNFTDLAVDLSVSNISHISLWRFMLKHPASLWQFAPFYWSRKWGFVYDGNLILIYFLVLILVLATALVASYI